ncbi:MAG: glycogen/starch/alpha-glucan phosphorylase [Infirmifilum sp.]
MPAEAIISITPEIALDEGFTYAGGLGVLEGDKFYAASRLGLNYHVLSLLYRGGYVDYEFDADGNPRPVPQGQPKSFLDKLQRCCELEVTLKGERVGVSTWVYTKGSARVVFFEPVEPDWAKSIVDRVFIERDPKEKFLKYVFLARASAEYIKNVVGVEYVKYIDLQEAYTALLPLVLNLPGYFRLIIHTPGSWGHPSFPREYFEQEFGYKMIEDKVVLTTLGAIMSRELIMVSAKHFNVMRRVIPHLIDKARFVTNGVDIERWMHPSIRDHLLNGGLNNGVLAEAKKKIREEAVRLVGSRKHVSIDPETPIVVWARRITKYKRPYFALKLIEEADRDVFFLLGGKAHPEDKEGLEYMRKFKELEKSRPNVVYFPDYDVQKARTILAGGDILLFTPFSGYEASGTSFMKAALNATASIASRDGAAIELIKDGVNGWLFGNDIRDLIDFARDPRVPEIDSREYEELKVKLAKALDLFRSDREGFLNIGLNAVLTFTPRVDITRVLTEYYPDLAHSNA